MNILTPSKMEMKSNTLAAVTLLLTVFLRTGMAYASNNGVFSYDSSNTRPIMCASQTNPCRINVKMRTFDGLEAGSNSVQTCSCNQPYECSDNWNKPRHVVNRKVVSSTYNITLQMMFCKPVEPTRLCNRRQIALEVQGMLTLPQDISAYNCRCRRRRPLIPHEQGIGENHLYYQKYVCSNHKSYCRGRSPCSTSNQYSTSYNCKCPRNTNCQIDVRNAMGLNTEVEDGDNIAYGFCVADAVSQLPQ